MADLMPLVYEDLKRRAVALMRRENAGHTLQSTALVNEAYLKLVDQRDVTWQSRAHFFGIASQAMRRILVDHARGRLREKRGGGLRPISLSDDLPLSLDRDEDVVALHEALHLLAELDPRQSSIVELRFFAGCTVDEVAIALGVSKRTIENDWAMAKAWLWRELGAA